MSHPRHLRPADLLLPVFGAGLLLWSRLAGVSLPSSRDSLAAWWVLAATWTLCVAVPLWVLPALGARAEEIGGHLLLAAVGAVLLATPEIRPPAAVVLLVLLVFAYGIGRGRPEMAPAELLFRFSPVLLAALAYVRLGVLLPQPGGRIFDATLAAIDGRLFGGDWSVGADRLATPWLSDWFSAHYAAYLAYPVIASLLLWLAGEKRRFEDLVLSFALAMFLGNVLYLAVPARGPVVFLAGRYPTLSLPGHLLTRATASLIGSYGYAYDVFPSLHTANAILCVWALKPRFPRLFAGAAFCAANLIASTIYLRAHYTVDVAAGIGLAVAVHSLCPRLNRVTELGLVPRLARAWSRLAG